MTGAARLQGTASWGNLFYQSFYRLLVFFFFLEEYILLPVSLLFQISRVENPGCHTTSCDDDTTRMPRSTPGTPVKSDSETTPVDPCFSHHQPHCRYSPALCKGSSENNLQRHSGAVFLCIFQHFIMTYVYPSKAAENGSPTHAAWFGNKDSER